MPVHQSYPSDSGLLIERRPSLLRLFGEALIALADRYEAAQAERRRRQPQDLPSYLRKDIGLPPLDIWPSHWDRW